jgi:hypothetical protein
MKDAIVKEIHRHRAEHARRFNYDVHAIGADIRRREAEGILVGLGARRGRLVEVKKSAAPGRRKAFAGK